MMSTCGVYGAVGPTLEACKEAYSDAQWLVNVEDGTQSIVIDKSGTYQLTAFGGGGGTGAWLQCGCLCGWCSVAAHVTVHLHDQGLVTKATHVLNHAVCAH